MQWYYALSGRQFGPVSADEMQNMALAGTIQPDTLIWRAGMGNWQPASQIGELSLPFPHKVSLGPTPGVPQGSSPYAPPPSSFHKNGKPPVNAQDINSTPALVLGIVSTLFCCIPSGIVAIIYAAQVGSKVARHDYEGARGNIKTSYIWSGVSIGVGLIFTVIYLALAIAGAGLE